MFFLCQCGLVAYLVRDWRTLHFVTSALILPQLLLWWAIPESPRWLITKKKLKPLEKVLRNMEKMNKKKIPENIPIRFEEGGDFEPVTKAETKKIDINFSHI